MKTLNKDDVIVQAIKSMKNGEYKATAIKLELEAQFDRGRNTNYSDDDEYCDYCDEGSVSCSTCDGNWDSDHECDECDGDGQVVTWAWRMWNNADEATRGTEPERYVTCDTCDGQGETSYCRDCEEGYNTCGECDGNYHREVSSEDSGNWGRDSVCHDWLMEKMSHLGLTEKIPEGENSLHLSHGVTSRWRPIGALKYAEFYRDGSVDSEMTLTISVEDEKNVYLLPKIIDIWKQLGEAIGNGMNIRRAGMHTAIMSTPDFKYPVQSTPEQEERFKNFQKSMNLLLPALYFLASGNDESRELGFRQPRIASARSTSYSNNKYSAVYYNGQALEYRIFNTCYDNPDTILDNIVVIANTLKWWTTVYKPSGLSKIAKAIRFGNENSDKLERFYITDKQIELLNAGLKKLKPSYYTVRQVKEQRQFTRTKRYVKKYFAEKRTQAEDKYREYCARNDIEHKIREQRTRAEFMEQIAYNAGRWQDIDLDDLAAKVEESIQRWLQNNTRDRMTLEAYVAEEMQNIEHSLGRYDLEEVAPEPPVAPRPTSVHFANFDDMLFTNSTSNYGVQI